MKPKAAMLNDIPLRLIVAYLSAILVFIFLQKSNILMPVYNDAPSCKV